MNNVVKIASDLIKFKTITPRDEGIFDYIKSLLPEFKSIVKYFGEGEKRTGNIYLEYGCGKTNFCFAGHVDVVPVGDIAKWKYDPFGAVIEDGILYGRGAVDMKGEIACFIDAVRNFITNCPDFDGKISLLLTADEEDTGEFGLKEMIKFLHDEEKISISACIIGEPTCESCIGDSIKVGRRGSVNFVVEFLGTQGHVAYKDLINNPITTLGHAITIFKNHVFDKGNVFFEPTNLEFVDVSTDNFAKATNVVPAVAKAMFNIRYNNLQTGEELVNFIDNTLGMICGKDGYRLTHRISNDAFLFGDTQISQITKGVIESMNISNVSNVISNCTGGTTDGRYIINYCKNTVELGLNEFMAHKIDESVAISDLEILSKIYYNILTKLL